MSYLYRTADFSSSNDSKCVLSFWVKKTVNDIAQGLFLGWNTSSNYATCYVNTDDTIYYKEKQGGTQYETRITSGARKFRDTNAWYHFVFQWDYTQATASNRIKVWINGELQTWENTGNLPPQNNSLRLKSSDFRIGDYTHAGSSYFNWKGLMSHVHFIDDAPYDTYQASTFGETDSTTGEWKIKTNPGIATNNYGSQGFFVLKDGNSGTDQSGKGNNLSTSGTITKTEDCPSNVFATFNPLTNWTGQNRTPSQVLNKGNLTTGIGSSEKALLLSTIGVTSGKYYWEAKSDGVSKMFFGFSNRLVFDTSSDPHSQSGYNGVYYYEGTPDFRTYGSNTSTTGIASISSSDILGFALDMDNHAFYIHKNGTYMNSGSPTSGSSRTGSIAELFTYGRNCLSDYDEVFASAYVTSTSGSGTASFNFGNGYFGTTQVSSAGTNASGNGIFEYDVPAGYTALSTKGLNL